MAHNYEITLQPPLYKSRLVPSSPITFSLFLFFFSSSVFHQKLLQFVLLPSELANSQETLEEIGNKRVVLALYEALSARDVDKVQKLLASDLEWWFHGPPSQQFLMRLLTGTATSDKDLFNFVPQSVAAFGSTVIVEGSDPTRNINWVHAWTVTDGIITQVREYFNTSLTVTRIGNADQSDISAAITHLHCPSVWESSLSSQVGKSVPGLVLAIWIGSRSGFLGFHI